MALRKTLIRIVIDTNGGITERYLMSLSPYEISMIDTLVAELIAPPKKEGGEIEIVEQ